LGFHVIGVYFDGLYTHFLVLGEEDEQLAGGGVCGVLAYEDC
jgi:hypothetical protein